MSICMDIYVCACEYMYIYIYVCASEYMYIYVYIERTVDVAVSDAVPVVSREELASEYVYVYVYVHVSIYKYI